MSGRTSVGFHSFCLACVEGNLHPVWVVCVYTYCHLLGGTAVHIGSKELLRKYLGLGGSTVVS